MGYLTVCEPCFETQPCFLFIGESGLGKSTLVNSIFITNLYPNRKVPDAAGMFNNRTRSLLHNMTLFMLTCFETFSILKVKLNNIFVVNFL